MQYVKAKELLIESLQLEQYPSMYRQIPDRACNPKYYDMQIEFWTKFLINWGKKYNVVSFEAKKLEESLMWNDIYPPLASSLKKLLKSKIIKKTSSIALKRSLITSIVSAFRCEDTTDYENIDYCFIQNFDQISKNIREIYLKLTRCSYDLVVCDEELIQKFNVTSIPLLTQAFEKNNFAVRLPQGGFLFHSDIIQPPPPNLIDTFLMLKKSICQAQKKLDDIGLEANNAHNMGQFELEKKYRKLHENSDQIVHSGKRSDHILEKGFSDQNVINQTKNTIESLQNFILTPINTLLSQVSIEPATESQNENQNDDLPAYTDPTPSEPHPYGNVHNSDDDFDIGFMPTSSVYKK